MEIYRGRRSLNTLLNNFSLRLSTHVFHVYGTQMQSLFCRNNLDGMTAIGKKILVMGMGNILLQDEGVGVRAIEYMLDKDLPLNVDLLDGGTGGFTLLPEIQKYDEVILIDATLDQHPVGTIRIIQPKFSKDFPKAMSTHDIGLKDLIDSASILGNLPPLQLIVITIKNIQPMDLDLSPEIENILPDVYETVKGILM